MRVRSRVLARFAAAVLLAGCASPPAASPGTAAAAEHGLTEAETATLLSLTRVDDHPLYTMQHYAPDPLVEYGVSRDPSPGDAVGGPAWGCSLFAALADPETRVFGRNFDWQYSPALLVYNDPPGGYASAAMVDIEYLGFPGAAAENLTDRPLGDLVGLLDAPLIPFDGINEAGLVIGMAAVPSGDVLADPTKGTVDSLGIIRLALDGAADVEEAIEVFHAYNVDFEGQTPLHYLMADSGGAAALVEFHRGEIRVLRSEAAWHHATNFLRSSFATPEGRCGRYDTIADDLADSGGMLDADAALDLLARVAQPHTQWSVVYGLDSGEIRVVMGQAYERVHTFFLEMGE